MAIRRMGIANPLANTSTLIFTSAAAYLSSVIISNKAGTDATARVWIAPLGTTTVGEYGYILYDVVIPAGESLESHRFGISNEDEVYVRASTDNLSFSLTGIYDSTASIDAHILQTTNVHGIVDTSDLVTTSVTNALDTRLISIELGLGIFD